MSENGPFGLALPLAALAGWVDVAGLKDSGGVFLSFMSGNTARFATSISHQDWARAASILPIIGLFVLGVMAGEIIEPFGGRRGQSLVLGIETLLLGIGAVLHWPALAVPGLYSLYPLVFAMGLQNSTMHRAGGISIGLTYVTGTLVQIGRSLAAAVGGGGDGRKLGEYIALWVSLAIGAGLGALVLSISVLVALVVATTIAGALAVLAGVGRR